MHRPLLIFASIEAVLVLGGFTSYLYGRGTGHVQSLILAAILSIIGFQVLLIGLMARLIQMNRKILEDILYHVRRTDIDKHSYNQ